ncbi:MAG: hypothetical protein AB2L12_11450 [Smithellaceae bacterium]
MNLSPYELVLIAGGFTFIGALVGGWIGYKNALCIYNITEFNKSANKFREAFTEEIRFIDRFYAADRASRDIPEVLAAAADKHETALIIFKDGFLCETQRTEIEKAWQAYTGDDKLMGKYTFRQYATKGNIKDGESIRQLALNNINNILKFAKHK